MSVGRLLWIQRISGDPADAYSRARTIAQKDGWTKTASDVGPLRLFLIDCCFAMSALGSAPPKLIPASESGPFSSIPGPKSYAQIEMAPTAVEVDFQNMLASAVIALATGKAMKPEELPQPPANGQALVMDTTDDAPAQSGYAAFLPALLAGVAIVATAGALAAALIYMISLTAESLSQKVTADEKKETLLSTMAAAVTVIEVHKAAEATAGHPLPYDEEETKILSTLRAAIGDAVNWEPPPLRGVPDLHAMTTSAAGAIKDAGKSASSIVPILALGAVGIFFLERRARRSRRAA